MKKHTFFGIITIVIAILCAGCMAGSGIEGTYGVDDRPDLTLILFEDGTFYYDGNWYEISGEYSVKENTVYFKTFMGSFTGKIENDTITDSEDGIVWVKVVD